jgi:uncharacterized protein YdaU (DUF1376 family)
MKHWPRDVEAWRKRTASLSFEDQGAYAALMDAYYASEGPLPADPQALYRLVGAMSKRDQKAVDRILANTEFFHVNGSHYHNERADLEIKKYQVFCEDQRRRRLGIKK